MQSFWVVLTLQTEEISLFKHCFHSLPGITIFDIIMRFLSNMTAI